MSSTTIYLGNPFTKMKNIVESQKLIDIAFRKAMKIKPPKARTGELDKFRTYESNRVNTVSNIFVDRLDGIVHEFPSINLLHPFYADLLQIICDINNIKKMLGRIHGTKRFIIDLTHEIIAEIYETEKIGVTKTLRKSAFGRLAKLIRNLNKAFKTLETIRIQLSSLPSYDPSVPCVVVCGLPNVGKSSFIRATTSGKPEVASYPFTTKKLIFGHRKYNYLSIQFVDTPGLLDRQLTKRNEIELQALAALKHLADIMIYLFDFTQNSENIINSQIRLFREIRKFYPASNFIVVITKIDLLSSEELEFSKNKILQETIIDNENDILTLSVKSNDDVTPLVARIQQILQKSVFLSGKFREMMQFNIEDDDSEYSDENLWFLN